MLDKSYYSDCTVVVEGKAFHLHRFVLASRCTFFQTEFATGKREIILHDISKKVFRGIIDYLYTDTVRRLDNMLEEDFVQLFAAAKTFFKLPELMKKCEYYIYQRVDISTVVSIFQMIQDLEMPILRRACLDYMASELKRLTKLGHISTLSSAQLSELKKRKKEVKKALESEEKIQRKNTLKKIESFHNVPSPETFFLKRKVDAAMKPEKEKEGKTLTRRNSSTW